MIDYLNDDEAWQRPAPPRGTRYQPGSYDIRQVGLTLSLEDLRLAGQNLHGLRHHGLNIKAPIALRGLEIKSQDETTSEQWSLEEIDKLVGLSRLEVGTDHVHPCLHPEL